MGTEQKYTHYLRQASGQYLTDYLPDDWEELGKGSDDPDSEYYSLDDLQMMWLEDHVWEPFEHYPGKQIYEFIDNAARVLERNDKEQTETCPHCGKEL